MNWIDLSHVVDTNTPTWNGSCGYHLEVKMTHKQGCLVHQVKLHAGMATHVDTPLHFCENGLHAADLPLSMCVGPLVCIHAAKACQEDDVFGIKELFAWEKKFGSIEKDSFVLVHTGWDKRWPHDAYRNVKSDGKMLFPSISKDVAEYLCEKEIKGLGVDTLSPDVPTSGFPVHHILLKKNKIILENLCNLEKVAPRGGMLICAPIKWKGASEAPSRVLAYFPHHSSQ